jgi:predicted peroxiredoxin
MPKQCATPFFHAAAAAAAEVEVEVYFTAGSVLLLQPGAAAALHAGDAGTPSILDWMRDAHAHGARFFACTDALAAHGLARDALIAEVSGFAGAAAFMGRALDDAWATLVY